MAAWSPLNLTEIEISCLPKDLPEFIALDLMDLELGGIIHLSEVPLPEGVELAQAPDPDGRGHSTVVMAVRRRERRGGLIPRLAKL